MPALNANRMAMSVCPDEEVRDYIEDQAADFGHPYAPPGKVKTGEQLFAAARKRFGDRRCIGLSFSIH
jgi:hypothetical protein